MPHLIPLSRLARLVGQPRSVLQRMAQSGELATFDGHVDLEEVLRHFPDVQLNDESEIRRVEEIKEHAVAKAPARLELPEASVLRERLQVLGRDFASAQGKMLHFERVIGWIGEKLNDAVERGAATRPFADELQHWLKEELASSSDERRRWEEFLARERIMRVLSAQVTVLPKGQTFEILGDESFLEAGLRAGLAMPYGCSNGSCGDCKCRTVSGEVLKVHPHDFPLSAAERQQGYMLACSYTAVGDVSIEVPFVGVAELPEQTIRARVRAVEPLGGNRIALHLITSRAERLRYFAGQWLEIMVDGKSRRVPAASCPCDERRLEVHVLCEEPSADAPQPFSTLKVNAEITVHGPFGSFVLDDVSQRPLVLLAQGAGFGQIKSILQHALSLDHAPSIALFRHASEEGLYQENLLKSYAGALENFRYTAFDATADRQSLLTAVGEAVPILSGHDVYAAGDAEFIAATRRHCLAAGLPESQFKAETIA